MEEHAAHTMPTNGKKEVVKTIMKCLKSNLGSKNLISVLVDVTVIEEAERWRKSKMKLIRLHSAKICQI